MTNTIIIVGILFGEDLRGFHLNFALCGRRGRLTFLMVSFSPGYNNTRIGEKLWVGFHSTPLHLRLTMIGQNQIVPFDRTPHILPSTQENPPLWHCWAKSVASRDPKLISSYRRRKWVSVQWILPRPTPASPTDTSYSLLLLFHSSKVPRATERMQEDTRRSNGY